MNRQAVQSRTPRGELQRTKRRITTYMLVWTVIAYFVLCTPIVSLEFINYFIVRLSPLECSENTATPVWYTVTILLIIMATFVNPFIFCYFDAEFRDAFKSYANRFSGKSWFRLPDVALKRIESNSNTDSMQKTGISATRSNTSYTSANIRIDAIEA